MKTIQDMKQLMQKENILFDQVELPRNTLGHFETIGNDNCILISDSVKMQNNDQLLKCILAEEIGHYFTTIGINNPMSNNTYYQNMLIEKEEIKAAKWATDYLIDTDLLLDYLSRNTLARIPDISEYFQVTEEFVLQKLEFMKRKDSFWKVKGELYLCLFRLPLLFVENLWDERFIDFLESD
jgi:hypothetical protein